MDPLFLIFVVVPGVILFFGASIFLHELGHFWVARKLGMQVDEFAIGFGPVMWSKTINGVVWSVRWIPAGGFVKLPQMITSEALEGATKDGEPIPPAPPGHRILVAFAGPLMNVIFAFAVATLIYFIGVPQLVNPSYIGYVEAGSAEEEMGIKSGDLIVSINGHKVDTWEKIFERVALAPTDTFKTVIERDGVEKTYMLKAVPVSSEVKVKRLNLGMREHPFVGAVQAGTPADKAGLLPKDKIVSFNGIEVNSQSQLIDLVNSRKEMPTELVVARGDEEMTFTITPQMIEGDELKRARIGIAFGTGGIYRIQYPSPLKQVADVASLTLRTVKALVQTKKTGVGLGDMSGPPGIAMALASNFNTDVRLALKFLILLNINLAILNLLPIPVLDGGHITMAVIEKIIRRPLSIKFVEVTTMACAFALISMMLYVSFKDIGRFPLFKSMFDNEVRIEQSDSP